MRSFWLKLFRHVSWEAQRRCCGDGRVRVAACTTSLQRCAEGILNRCFKLTFHSQQRLLHWSLFMNSVFKQEFLNVQYKGIHGQINDMCTAEQWKVGVVRSHGWRTRNPHVRSAIQLMHIHVPTTSPRRMGSLLPVQCRFSSLRDWWWSVWKQETHGMFNSSIWPWTHPTSACTMFQSHTDSCMGHWQMYRLPTNGSPNCSLHMCKSGVGWESLSYSY